MDNKININAPTDNKHHRRSIRLQGYDYSQEGYYFITLCTKNREYLFGEIIDGKMHKNIYGDLIEKEWLKTSEIRKNISLGEYIIMPNHFHAIIKIDYQIKENKDIAKFKSPSHTIGAIARGFKGATTKKIKEICNGVWQNAPTEKDLGNGVWQYAPTEKDLGSGVWQYAPTENNESLNAPKVPIDGSIWQRNYWERVIRNEKEYLKISEYIINNPLQWEFDKLNNEKSVETYLKKNKG